MVSFRFVLFTLAEYKLVLNVEFFPWKIFIQKERLKLERDIVQSQSHYEHKVSYITTKNTFTKFRSNVTNMCLRHQ